MVSPAMGSGHDRIMDAEQLDLFLWRGAAPVRRAASEDPPAVEQLDDPALVAALADAGLADAPRLAVEAGRRRLVAAIPALVTLCRLLTGFGAHHPVPEQVAALEALRAIDGTDAARAVAQLICEGAFLGRTLAIAVAAAARLHARLAPATVRALLRDPDPQIRVAACRCARPAPGVAEVLIELVGDLHRDVSAAATCALGLMGRNEARSELQRLIRDRPSAEVIDALATLGDEDAIALLARLGRARPELAPTVLLALDAMEHPRADRAAAALRAWSSDHGAQLS
jgi:hypothetical protein